MRRTPRRSASTSAKTAGDPVRSLNRQWRRLLDRPPLCPIDQVANARDATFNLTPVSQAPADAVKAGWQPMLAGQEVPLIWERVYDDAQPCYDV